MSRVAECRERLAAEQACMQALQRDYISRPPQNPTQRDLRLAAIRRQRDQVEAATEALEQARDAAKLEPLIARRRLEARRQDPAA